MKLLEIWKKIGKQPFRIVQHKDAIVYIGDDKYIISNIKYDNGKFLGFEGKKLNEWKSSDTLPEEHRWVIVKDKKGEIYNYHQWVGHAWYSFCINNDGTCDGWRSSIDVVSWKYQYE